MAIDKTNVIQIGILTHNAKDTAEKWAKFLGAPVPKLVMTDRQELTGATLRGQPCDGLLLGASVKFGNIEVEFLQPVDDTPSIWRECLDRDGEGLHHIAFKVHNMDESVKEAEKAGFPCWQRGEFSGGDKGRYAYMDAFRDLKIIMEFLEFDA
jgi:catechol 2,3-dioxygenase-like lactoylglutathione lyase family enzyme